MFTYRWATGQELPMIACLWHRMACEMGKLDGIPVPDEERQKEVQMFFENEYNAKRLNFRVALNDNGEIIACAGGLVRKEYAFPLSGEQTLFGWVVAVYTAEHCRRNGLASRLVGDVCSWLKEQGAERARLWPSSSAAGMYGKLGFTRMIDMEKPLI